MSIADKLDALSCLYTAAVVEQLLEAAVHSPGVVVVSIERLRQISAEGYDAAHDDGHPGEMAMAGAHYGFNAAHAIANAYDAHERAHVPAGWPWKGSAWKPKTPERDIERGAALLVAEYDALHRHNLCPMCDGDGVPPHEPGTSPCPACEGTGKARPVTVSPPVHRSNCEEIMGKIINLEGDKYDTVAAAVVAPWGLFGADSANAAEAVAVALRSSVMAERQRCMEIAMAVVANSSHFDEMAAAFDDAE